MSEKKNMSLVNKPNSQSIIQELDMDEVKEIIINERDIEHIKLKILQLKEYKFRMDKKIDEIEECNHFIVYPV